MEWITSQSYTLIQVNILKKLYVVSLLILKRRVSMNIEFKVCKLNYIHLIFQYHILVRI